MRTSRRAIATWLALAAFVPAAGAQPDGRSQARAQSETGDDQSPWVAIAADFVGARPLAAHKADYLEALDPGGQRYFSRLEDIQRLSKDPGKDTCWALTKCPKATQTAYEFLTRHNEARPLAKPLTDVQRLYCRAPEECGKDGKDGKAAGGKGSARKGLTDQDLERYGQAAQNIAGSLLEGMRRPEQDAAAGGGTAGTTGARQAARGARGGMVGMTLGQLSDPLSGGPPVELKVSQTFGAPEGYDNMMQAAAAARMSGSDRAVVVEQPKGRWHAVATDIPMEQAGGFTSRDGIESVLPQRGTFNADGYKLLKDKLKQAQASQDRAATDAAWKELAAYTLGVPEDQINLITRHDQRVAGKINVNVGREAGEDGQTGNPHSASSKFDPDIRDAATEVNGIAFTATPEHAQEVEAHEGIHAHNNRRAHQLYDDYRRAKAQAQPFGLWLELQRKAGRVSQKDAAIARGLAGNDLRNDEASAYVGAFMASFGTHPAGSPVFRVADELLGAGQWASDHGGPDPDMQEALRDDLRAFYKTLGTGQRPGFDAAFDRARTGFKSTWLAKLDYKK